MSSDLGDVFRLELARAAGSVPELTPATISRAAATALTATSAGVSLLGAEISLPVGASSPEASAAEQIQATLGDGPCSVAARRGAPMVVGEAELSQRWPVYYDLLVARTSLRSVLALPLADDDGVFGILTIYSTRPAFTDLPPPEVIHDQIGRLAGQILLGAAAGIRTRDASGSSQATDTDQARYRTRLQVWTAIGLVMSAANRDSGDALALLRGYAFSHDLTLDQVGQQLISRNLQPSQII